MPAPVSTKLHEVSALPVAIARGPFGIHGYRAGAAVEQRDCGVQSSRGSHHWWHPRGRLQQRNRNRLGQRMTPARIARATICARSPVPELAPDTR